MEPSRSPIATDLWNRLPRPLIGIEAAAVGLVIAVVSTGAGIALSSWLSRQSVAFLYLLAVVLSAIGLGVRTGLVVGVLSSLAYNFFFIPPVYTFSIADLQDVFAYISFLAVALIAGSLAGRLREVADLSQRREATLRRLNEFAAELSAARSEDAVLWALARHGARLIGGECIVMRNRAGELVAFAKVPDALELSTADWQAGRRALRNRQSEYPPIDNSSSAYFEFHPVFAADAVVGLIGLTRRDQPPMSRDIREAIIALVQHANIALDRTRLEGEAVRMRGASERERLRSAILSSLSHDLRTPLASIVGSASSLRTLGDKLRPETRVDLLAAIEEEAERLAQFVTNLLHMTRLETESIDLRNDWIEVGEVAQSAVARMRRLKTDAMIVLECPSSLPAIRGNAVLLEHVIFNLLDNSAKFSNRGSGIDVSISAANSKISLVVVDQGRGIPADVRSRLFEAFNRTKSSDEDVGGTGLGLAISNRVIEGMGGSITVDSPISDGRGTRVTITLPVPAEPGRKSVARIESTT